MPLKLNTRIGDLEQGDLVRDDALEGFVHVHEQHRDDQVNPVAVLRGVSDAGEAVNRDGNGAQSIGQYGCCVRADMRRTGQVFDDHVGEDRLLAEDVGAGALADHVFKVA